MVAFKQLCRLLPLCTIRLSQLHSGVISCLLFFYLNFSCHVFFLVIRQSWYMLVSWVLISVDSWISHGDGACVTLQLMRFILVTMIHSHSAAIISLISSSQPVGVGQMGVCLPCFRSKHSGVKISSSL